jgi:hypothetical protein
MKSDNKKLPIFQTLIAFAAFIAIVGTLFYYLSEYSKERKRTIYQNYASETNTYISKNKDGLNTIFNKVFIPCTSYYSPQCVSTESAQIPHLVTSDLKDWSSTVFLKEYNGAIYYMRLSGDMGTLYAYDTENKILLEKLLRGEVSEIPWGEYVYELPTKEVVVAVKDETGHVVGAIARGVIETN